MYENVIIVFAMTIIALIVYIFKYNYESNKSHKIYMILGKLDDIRILDNTGLIAIVNSNRSVEWFRDVSIYKISKVRDISNRYDEEVIKLKHEMLCH